MADSSQVTEVLKVARGFADQHWGTTNRDVPATVDGWMCASVAISTVAGGCSMSEISVEAHVAFLRAAGVEVPESGDAILEAVYAFNDAQPDKAPVLAAFDAAIAMVDEYADADETLAVMAACDRAGAAVAHAVLRERPDLDEVGVAAMASSELFYAAQDAVQACLASEVGA